MSRYSNCFACLTIMLVCSSSSSQPTNRSIETFLKGDKTSIPPAALPVLHSGPRQCRQALLTHALTMQLDNMQPTSSKCSSLPLLTLATAHTKWCTVAITTGLDSFAAILALLQSHPRLYCTWYLLNIALTFHLLIKAAVKLQEFHLTKNFTNCFALPLSRPLDILEDKRRWFKTEKSSQATICK